MTTNTPTVDDVDHRGGHNGPCPRALATPDHMIGANDA